MKKLQNISSYLKATFLLIGCMYFLNSCDNTLNLVEPGADVPVAYALLSSTTDEQFIRVERGFIDPLRPASEIAQIADSLYYPNAIVRLVNETQNTSFVLDQVDAKTLGFNRAEGFFLTDPNFIYYHIGSATDFRPGDRVTFELQREEGDEPVTASINLLDTLLISTPKPSANINIPTQADYRIQWANFGNNPAVLYSVNYIIHYEEANLLDEEPEFEPKVIRWRLGEVRDESILSIPGIEFYKFMGSNLEKDEKYVRTFEYMDAEFVYSGEELVKYLDFINANTGITSSQPIPPYTNLSEGLGLIAERNVQYVRNVFLSNSTVDSLRFGQFTKDLGFN